MFLCPENRAFSGLLCTLMVDDCPFFLKEHRKTWVQRMFYCSLELCHFRNVAYNVLFILPEHIALFSVLQLNVTPYIPFGKVYLTLLQ